MNNDFYEYLISTNQIDDFLGYELPQKVKIQINELADEYKYEIINDDEIQDVLMALEIEFKINYELLYKYFKEQLNK